MAIRRRIDRVAFGFWASAALVLLALGGGCEDTGTPPGNQRTVPRESRFGIYSLDLSTQDVSLIYSDPAPLFTSTLSLNSRGDTLAFAQFIECATNECSEIAVVGVDGGGYRRVTSNDVWDLYPSWSPDDGKIAFLSWRDADLDVYVMNADGSAQRMLFDSGSHDGDVNWRGDKIVFTSGCRIWSMSGEGGSPTPLTDPPRACEWGDAVLPFGDYDPRLSAGGETVVFERVVADESPHGNYDLFRMASDGSGETRLTSTGHTQGLGSWSYSGTQIVFNVSAIDEVGRYRLYLMSADGSDSRDVTPSYFPPEFLCHAAVFSRDDSRLYFIGEWWQ